MSENAPPLRLAFISLHTSPLARPGQGKIGGMNIYLRELSRELARRGHRIDIFTYRALPDLPEIDRSIGEGARVIHLPIGGSARPLSHDELLAAQQEFAAGLIGFATRNRIRYDLAYSHYWLSGWVADKLKEIWRIPFAQMFHTLGQMKERIAGIGFPSARSREEMKITEWADAIIAATPAERAQLRWLYRADRRKIHIVPPGVDTARFRPRPATAARAGLSLPADAKILLFVGRIDPLKAVDDILQALARIRSENGRLFRELRLLVAGGNPRDVQPLRRLCARLGLPETETVQFLGPLPQRVLPAYYAAADLVIMPSDYESFGMVALEAQASGRPVIATQVGGLAHLIEDGRTGRHIPTREPAALAGRIIDLLSDPQRAAAMGRAAAANAARYAWPRIADELLEIFEKMLGRVACRR